MNYLTQSCITTFSRFKLIQSISLNPGEQPTLDSINLALQRAINTVIAELEAGSSNQIVSASLSTFPLEHDLIYQLMVLYRIARS